MEKEYKYDGETFLLEYSEEGYIKVTYQDQVGILGVAENGTPDLPYRWAVGISSARAGLLTSGTSTRANVEGNLNSLCADLMRNHQISESRKSFKPKGVRETIEEYYKKLP